jgi:hypothetical protein
VDTDFNLSTLSNYNDYTVTSLSLFLPPPPPPPFFLNGHGVSRKRHPHQTGLDINILTQGMQSVVFEMVLALPSFVVVLNSENVCFLFFLRACCLRYCFLRDFNVCLL